MTASIHVLHPSVPLPASAPPIAGYLRVGHTGQRKLEALSASGRCAFKRFVFDAGHLAQQKELKNSLQAKGSEIVLDPNFAEMAAPGRFQTAISKLPWANVDRPWVASDFGRVRNLNIARAIAELAVAEKVNAVLAPTHMLEGPRDSWIQVDRDMCQALRNELDRLGGGSIGIDYQLITTNALLKDADARATMIDGLHDLPIKNLWVRISGFGATATGAGTRHFIECMRALHSLDLPIIADNAGGFAALGAAAYGAIGGLCHGTTQRESFRANDWKREASGGGGTKARVYIVELDRYFDEDQLSHLFSAKGGKSRLACNDPTCCKHGAEDMIENSHAHFLTQRGRQIENLSKVPEQRRAEHFLLNHVDPAVRAARLSARLKVGDEKVLKAVIDAKTRLIRFRDALADLQSTDADVSRSSAPMFRGAASTQNSAAGQ